MTHPPTVSAALAPPRGTPPLAARGRSRCRRGEARPCGRSGRCPDRRGRPTAAGWRPRVTALHHDHPHRDVDKWARVARQIKAASQPVERPPAKRPPAWPDEPTYRDHRAWEYALTRPCERHGAEPGALCWDGAIRAMCADRTRTLGHAAVSRRTCKAAASTPGTGRPSPARATSTTRRPAGRASPNSTWSAGHASAPSPRRRHQRALRVPQRRGLPAAAVRSDQGAEVLVSPAGRGRRAVRRGRPPCPRAPRGREVSAVACRGCGVATTDRVSTVPRTTPVGQAMRPYEVGVCDACATLDLDGQGSAAGPPCGCWGSPRPTGRSPRRRSSRRAST